MIMNMWFTEWFGTWGWLIALVIGLTINIPLFVWARSHRHLTIFACIIATFLGIASWMINPIFYFALFAFFISSNLLTKYRKKDKQGIQDKFEKGGERDTSQVLANGLGSFIFALAHLLMFIFTDNVILSNAFIYAAIAAIATVTADTWGTEIGILSNDQPFWILNLRKKVERGTSGGISPKGTGAAFIGAISVSVLMLVIEIIWKNPIPASTTWQLYLFIPLAGIAGFIGAFIDSLLGATIQGFFKCQVCEKGTEKKIHCNEPTIITRGQDWFRNDHVNFWSSFLAGVIAFGFGCFGFLL